MTEQSLLPYLVGHTPNGRHFAFYGNGGVRRLFTNVEIIRLRDELQVRTLEFSDPEGNVADVISAKLYGV